MILIHNVPHCRKNNRCCKSLNFHVFEHSFAVSFQTISTILLCKLNSFLFVIYNFYIICIHKIMLEWTEFSKCYPYILLLKFSSQKTYYSFVNIINGISLFYIKQLFILLFAENNIALYCIHNTLKKYFLSFLFVLKKTKIKFPRNRNIQNLIFAFLYRCKLQICNRPTANRKNIISSLLWK